MAVADHLAKIFPLRNAGEAPVRFSWAVCPPFALNPLTGHLQPGQTVLMTATFAPTQAQVGQQRALCSFGEGQPPVSVTLHGVGKYPYIRPSVPVVDFGEVVVGRSAERALQLLNVTPAAADFWVARAAGEDHDQVYALSLVEGRLSGGAKVDLKVTFTPAAAGAFSSEAFVVRTSGGAPASLCCRGRAVGAPVSLSSQLLAFGAVAVGAASPWKYLQLDNGSDLPVRFHVDGDHDTGGAFTLSEAAGTVPARSFAQLGVSFRPGGPTNHHRRLTLLLADATPLACDLLGTGYTPKARPPAVGAAELGAARAAVAPAPGSVAASAGAERDFMAGGEAACFLELDAGSVLDFGAQKALRAPEVRTVTLRNRSGCTLEVFWHRPPAPGGPSPPQHAAFLVLPESTEVQPHGSACFRISFRPNRAGCVYAQTLELHGHVRSQRSWRMADPNERVLPPWSARLSCLGHTHAASPEMPPPTASLPTLPPSRRCAFPATRPGVAVHRTLALLSGEPPGGAAVTWALRPFNGDHGAAFAARPAAGVIPPGNHALICLSFTPPAEDGGGDGGGGGGVSFSAPLRFTLNGREAPSLDAEATGTACVPAVTLAPGEELRLRPTCVGGATQRRVRVHNPTRLALHAAWQLPAELAGVCAPSPAAFRLEGREGVDVSWAFTPQAAGVIDSRVCLRVWASSAHPQGAGQQEQLLPATAQLRLTAHVAPCSLRCEPASLQAGTLCLGGASSPLALTLHNDSDAPVEYGWGACEPPGALQPADGGGSGRGCLGAGEARVVHLTLRQLALGATTARISLALGAASTTAPHADDVAAAAASSSLLVEVHSLGAVPRLRLCAAALPRLTPEAAWLQLRGDALNGALDGEGGAGACGAEAGGQLPAAGAVVPAVPVVPVLLGVAAPGEPPSTAALWLHNPSPVAATWALALEEEEEEARELRLFDWAPRRGVLRPGERACVAVAYAHDAPGRHAARARLSLVPPSHARGVAAAAAAAPRHVTLLFQGRTTTRAAAPALRGPGLSSDGKTLLVTLPPQPLGLAQPVTCCVVLRSACAAACSYSLDTAALEELNRAQQFAFPVLGCANPSGMLPPNGAAALHFTFRPIQAGHIALAMPLLLLSAADGAVGQAAEVVSLQLSSRGFHPAKEEREASTDTLLPAASMEPPPASPGPLGCVAPASLAFEAAVAPGGRVSAQVLVSPAGDGAAVSFAWALAEGSLPCGATLSVSPQRGRLPPQGTLCTVTLCVPSGAPPAILSTALCCAFAPAQPHNSRAAKLAAATPQRAAEQAAAAGEEEEEVFAQHPQLHPRQPRPERGSVLTSATISSALKHPLALREMWPPAALPAASLAVTLAAAGSAGESLLLAVSATVAAAAAAHWGRSAVEEGAAAFVDDYADLAGDFEEEEAADVLQELPERANGEQPPSAPPSRPGSSHGGPRVSAALSRLSTTSTTAVEGALEELLDDWEDQGELLNPEDADDAAVAASDEFLDALEDMLNGLDESEDSPTAEDF